jgi:DHA3 family macrolide efflux protein-like MFS transporter
MPLQFRRFTGNTAFYWIYIGQLFSWVGTAMTRYALIIWAYEKTNAATTLGLLGFFAWIPLVLVSPLAGVVVDRLDRRTVMILADLGGGLVTLGLLGLHTVGALQIWHLFLAETLSAVFSAFQTPAYNASSTLLVSKENYSKINGLNSTALSASDIFAPILAGLLLTKANLNSIFMIDLATLLIALLTLMFVVIPKPAVTDQWNHSRPNFMGEMASGFQFITKRPGLVGILLIFMVINFLAFLTYFSILPALILLRTGGDKLALSTVQSVLGIGGLVGAVLLSMWGGPKKRIHGFLLFTSLSFLLGDSMFAIGRSLPIWVIGGFISSIFIPFIGGSSMAIWMSKVPPEIQGRVFSVRSMGHFLMIPLGFLAGGFLADSVFEPAMQAGGNLAEIFGGLVGTGPGAGMALMFLITCILGTLTGLSGYLIRSIRTVEEDLPDHDVLGELSPSDAPFPAAASAD